MNEPSKAAEEGLSRRSLLRRGGALAITAGENRVPGMVEEVVYLGFHQEVRVRLANGTVVKVDVPNDDEQSEHEQGDPVCVHLPARHLRVLAADAGVQSAPAAAEPVPTA